MEKINNAAAIAQSDMHKNLNIGNARNAPNLS
jgi:hypothetical protein